MRLYCRWSGAENWCFDIKDPISEIPFKENLKQRTKHTHKFIPNPYRWSSFTYINMYNHIHPIRQTDWLQFKGALIFLFRSSNIKKSIYKQNHVHRPNWANNIKNNQSSFNPRWVLNINFSLTVRWISEVFFESLLWRNMLKCHSI